MPRFDASFDEVGVRRVNQRYHRARGLLRRSARSARARGRSSLRGRRARRRGRSRAVTLPRPSRRSTRAITSCPSPATMGATRARRSWRSFAIRTRRWSVSRELIRCLRPTSLGRSARRWYSDPCAARSERRRRPTVSRLQRVRPAAASRNARGTEPMSESIQLALDSSLEAGARRARLRSRHGYPSLQSRRGRDLMLLVTELVTNARAPRRRPRRPSDPARGRAKRRPRAGAGRGPRHARSIPPPAILSGDSAGGWRLFLVDQVAEPVGRLAGPGGHPRLRSSSPSRRRFSIARSRRVGGGRVADRRADVVVRAERAAGRDDHALLAERVRQLGAAEVAHAEPEEVRLAVGHVHPQLAQPLGRRWRSRATASRRRSISASPFRSACSTAAWVSAFTPSTGAIAASSRASEPTA